MPGSGGWYARLLKILLKTIFVYPPRSARPLGSSPAAAAGDAPVTGGGLAGGDPVGGFRLTWQRLHRSGAVSSL